MVEIWYRWGEIECIWNHFLSLGTCFGIYLY
jgi:hypothetical protein